MVLGDAAEPLPLRVAGAHDLKWSRHQVQVHAQLVEPKAILVQATRSAFRVVPTEPHAHPDMLCLYVEVLGALNVDQHQLAAVVEQIWWPGPESGSLSPAQRRTAACRYQPALHRPSNRTSREA